MAKTSLPEISIVIATYQRVDFLARLLDSLNCQTASKEIYEVIVVDNAPMESINNVKTLCDGAAYAGLDLHYIYHPDLGVSNARNHGVRNARASLIGFLDDDSLPRPDWVEKIIQVFLETKADILGGPFEPYYLSKKPSWFRDIYAGASFGDQAGWLTGTNAVIGCNMAYRKRVMEELGGFSTEFGYVGSQKIYGEDTELNMRARRAGYTTWYEPRLLIQHYADPERMRVSWFFSSGYRHGQSKARIFFREWCDRDSRPVARQILSQFKGLFVNLFNMIGSMFALPFRSRAKYPHWQTYAIECVCPLIGKLGMSVKMLELHFSRDSRS